MHDTLSTLFLACFLFGVFFTAISLVTGAAHISLPGGHGFHLGHLGHAGQLPHVSHGGQPASAGRPQGASPLNIGSLLAFLTWFGGGGYLLHTFSPLALVLVLFLAALAGLAGASIIFLFLLKVLMPAQTEMDPETFRLDGTAGRVTAGIPRGGTGEIIYSKAGTRHGIAARSLDGEPLPRNEEVVILSYQHGIAYVQSLKRYLSSSATEIAGELVALDDSRARPGTAVRTASEPTPDEPR